ncbi:alpha/beta hydrolase [Saccharopolyspora taberi]|uniref:Alpha/beta hydrolase n=1 Tax=Saccharopolyspora taberi TaxID=60895 RepID=A0ABN3V459_9PSEU
MEPEAPPLQPHTERKGPVGPVPPGMERYYSQTLSWGPCADFATSDEERAAYRDPAIECARLEVPMNHADPGGPTIRLGLLRKPATDPGQRVGSLLVNPGGPGASGMSTVAALAGSAGSTELGQRFDLVGFDPRGIGASEPRVRCLTDQERDADRLDPDSDTSPAGDAQTEQEAQDYAAKCAERTGAEMLANVGTRDVVKDMDVMRSALGDEKLSYLGYSYGTRIGSEYAEEFPRNVRGMVLDGAIDPGQNAIESLVAQGAGFQKAFGDFASWCAQQQNCAVGSDPAQAVKAFQDLTRPLVDRPVPTGGGRELSYSDATTAAIQALYAPDLWEQLNTGLLELDQGRGGMLMALADTYFGRGADGTYSSTMDAFDAVHCVDDERNLDPGVVREADRRYREAAPFLDDGRGPSAARDVCAFWPVPVTGEQTQPVVDGLPPVLVISTTGDPATPYRAGVELAGALHGRLLTFEGTQHTVFLQGTSCVDEAGTRYLVDGELPAEGTRCTG